MKYKEFQSESSQALEVAVELSSQQATDKVASSEFESHLARYQIVVLLILSVSFTSAGLIGYGLPYLYSQRQIKLRCFDPNGNSYTCNHEEACTADQKEKFQYLHDNQESFINWIVDYKLACSKESFLSLMGTAYFAGFFLGSIVFLPLSDYVGRKKLILIGLALQIVTILIIFFNHSIWYLFIFCSLIGLRTPMASHNAFVLLVEISKPSWRPLLSMYINGVDGGLFLILALIYKIIQSWKPLFIAVAVVAFINLIFVAILIPESPRYFLAKHKYREARRVFRRIAIMSGKQMFTDDLQGQNLYYRLSQDQSMIPNSSLMSSQTKDSVTDLWVGKSKREKCVLLLIPLGWFTVDILSYGLNFSINDLHGDIYVFGYIIGGTSLVVCLTGTFVANKLGRKGGFFLAWGFAAFGMTIYQFIQDVQVLPYILICISRYGASAAFGFCFLHTSQYFPTVFRGVMFGICNASARLGGIIAPEFSTVFFVGWFMLAFGIMALVMFILNVFNFETKGVKMKDNVGQESPLTSHRPKSIKLSEEQD